MMTSAPVVPRQPEFRATLGPGTEFSLFGKSWRITQIATNSRRDRVTMSFVGTTPDPTGIDLTHSISVAPRHGSSPDPDSLEEFIRDVGPRASSTPGSAENGDGFVEHLHGLLRAAYRENPFAAVHDFSYQLPFHLALAAYAGREHQIAADLMQMHSLSPSDNPPSPTVLARLARLNLDLDDLLVQAGVCGGVSGQRLAAAHVAEVSRQPGAMLTDAQGMAYAALTHRGSHEDDAVVAAALMRGQVQRALAASSWASPAAGTPEPRRRRMGVM